ncbi:protein kinase family protein [Kitasatospora sp. NPDC088391]|uniref:protein kinase family protein n=1 Tax=Kitasatospora sp. NPDC088391 TaxID=3364074 RepID=UPI00381DF43B
MDHGARTARYGTVRQRLAELDDRQVGEVAAEVGTAGLGGRTGTVEVGGTPVFVKRVPLTAPERERSTANVFGLPGCYQYGIGSAGFGAWRELAAHEATTDWVLARAYEGFPLMYHWRVVPDTPPTGAMDWAGGLERAVEHWGGDAAVRRRLEAIESAEHSLVVFLEHWPQTLGDWLDGHPDRAGGAPHAWAEQEITRGVAFLRAHGTVHFDAHSGNLLTDGETVCFADFGLMLREDFELSPAEREFFERHRDYDRYHALGQLVRRQLAGHRPDRQQQTDLLRAWVAGEAGTDRAAMTATAAGLLDRHARTTLAFEEFRQRLLADRRTPFPAEELAATLTA